LLWAEARMMGVERVLTFDRRFPSQGLELTGPG
jgi:predicted nucleic-acid-binding protein